MDEDEDISMKGRTLTPQKRKSSLHPLPPTKRLKNSSTSSSDDFFEDDNYEFCEDDYIPSLDNAISTEKASDFLVLDESKLVNDQQEKIISISETLGVSTGIAGVLSKYFNYNTEKLYNEFFDNKNETCMRAGVVIDGCGRGYDVGERDMTCLICYDDVKAGEMYGMNCRHLFCRKCWEIYLRVAIEDGYSCLLTQCPYRNCNIIISEELVKEIVTPELRKKYAKFIARSFVDDNPRIKWCPAPDCGKAVLIESDVISLQDTDNVICSCGQKFCFKCQKEAHAPCSCENLVAWKIKERDESETANWLTANTKICPKCHKAIEKNGGCNHMSCSQCKYEFCWVCMDDWKMHSKDTGGYYRCNRFSKEELKKKNLNDNSKRDVARKALEKYMHYFKRYANHSQSQKFEKQLLSKAELNMRKLQKKYKFSSWIDVEFIQKAVSQLIDCRNALKYTYIFGYYLNSGPEKEMFEFLQEELEKQTEELSELLEGPIENYDRDKILALTKNSEIRLKNLLKGCKKGLTTIY